MANQHTIGHDLTDDKDNARDAKIASPLLKLPAELRNHIYELVTWDTVLVVMEVDGRITNQPGLVATCRQIHDEALPMFCTLGPFAAGNIKAKVRNLDFAHIIVFIDGLSTDQARAAEWSITMHIRMMMDDSFDGGKEKVMDWLKYCGHSAFAEAITATSYHFVGSVDRLSWGYFRSLAWEGLGRRAKYQGVGMASAW